MSSRNRWALAATLCCLAVSCGNSESSTETASAPSTTSETVAEDKSELSAVEDQDDGDDCRSVREALTSVYAADAIAAKKVADDAAAADADLYERADSAGAERLTNLLDSEIAVMAESVLAAVSQVVALVDEYQQVDHPSVSDAVAAYNAAIDSYRKLKWSFRIGPRSFDDPYESGAFEATPALLALGAAVTNKPEAEVVAIAVDAFVSAEDEGLESLQVPENVATLLSRGFSYLPSVVTQAATNDALKKALAAEFYGYSRQAFGLGKLGEDSQSAALVADEALFLYVTARSLADDAAVKAASDVPCSDDELLLTSPPSEILGLRYEWSDFRTKGTREFVSLEIFWTQPEQGPIDGYDLSICDEYDCEKLKVENWETSKVSVAVREVAINSDLPSTIQISARNLLGSGVESLLEVKIEGPAAPKNVALNVSSSKARVSWDIAPAASSAIDSFVVTLCVSKPECKEIDTWETASTTRTFDIPIKNMSGKTLHAEVRSVNEVASSVVVESEPKKVPNKTESVKPKTTSPKSNSISIEEQQAVGSARSYLDYSAFSKTGLIEQLEYEGFPKSVATAAVNSLVVDWNEEAYQSGKSYLDYSSFSKTGLIEQLEYEGFTTAQARQAVNRLF